MDRWDVVLILIAGYVAVMSLVRLMRERRNRVMDHLRGEIEQQLGKAGPRPAKQAPEEATDDGAAA